MPPYDATIHVPPIDPFRPEIADSPSEMCILRTPESPEKLSPLVDQRRDLCERRIERNIPPGEGSLNYVNDACIAIQILALSDANIGLRTRTYLSVLIKVRRGD